jgi:CheY-like chemotaxis protein
MTSPVDNKIPRVLVVDDDEVVFIALVHFSKKTGLPIEFVYAEDVAQGVEKLNEACFDAALIDVRLPGVTGVSLGALVREHDVNIPLAYLTNLDTDAVRTEAVAQRAFFLPKLRFMGSDEGMGQLLKVVREMVQLNPCLQGGARIDNHGFARRLEQTPIEIPGVLATLLDYSKTRAQAA